MSDNESVVHVINKQSGKEKTLIKLVCSLVHTFLTHYIFFIAKHIPGKTNILADKHPRFQLHDSFKTASHLNPIPRVNLVNLSPVCRQ